MFAPNLASNDTAGRFPRLLRRLVTEIIASDGTSRGANAAATGGRVLSAALFLFSGIAKIAAPTATLHLITSVGLPAPVLAYSASLTVELGGGAMLVMGLLTRPVGAAMAVYTLVTGVVFHTHLADQDQLIHFLKDISIAGGLLQLLAFGGGGWSADAVVARQLRARS